METKMIIGEYSDGKILDRDDIYTIIENTLPNNVHDDHVGYAPLRHLVRPFSEITKKDEKE